MKVELDLIEKAVVVIFNEMRSRGLSSVELDCDFYWNIPTEQLYNVYEKPNELDIGQITDDYDTLKKHLENDTLIYYNLKNAAAVMRFLSQYHAVNSEIDSGDSGE
ncbi:hypothetical protein [Enterobacter cloacae]|uniref:Uncharacterized protein n=1 Tax=Enterobacter cloacae TaxID=550 RepID=A0A3R8YYB0_ENTCL|nr:hypothetical protein [Enterobacter cloacae]RSB20965.1 hypothetical protein EGK68_26230 [Enterobacter cloacae]